MLGVVVFEIMLFFYKLFGGKDYDKIINMSFSVAVSFGVIIDAAIILTIGITTKTLLTTFIINLILILVRRGNGEHYEEWGDCLAVTLFLYIMPLLVVINNTNEPKFILASSLIALAISIYYKKTTGIN